jgi:hypothetical protein
MSKIVILTLTLVACAPRSESSEARREEPPTYPDDQIVAAALQSTRALTLEKEVALDPPEARGWRTLGDLARDAKWELASCTTDECAGLTTRLSVPVAAKDPLELTPHRPYGSPFVEVRLLSVDLPKRCDWVLVARSKDGWFGPLELGSSAHGCTRPVDLVLVDELAPLWFPIATQALDGGLRLEGQGATEAGSMDLAGSTGLTRVTYLCRVGAAGPDTLACAREEVVVTPEVTWKSLGEARPIAPSSPSMAPGDLASVGATKEAYWILGMAPTEVLPSWMNASVCHVETALDRDEPVVVTSRATGYSVNSIRAGRARKRLSVYADYANETLAVRRVERVGDSVVVAAERVVQGPAQITTRWVDIVRVDRRFRLATGVTLEVGGERVGGWEREVVVEADGVRLSSRDGALAWFRGTGRFTWAELERQIPRWQKAFGRAWEASLRDPATRRKKASDREEIGTTVALRMVPGFIEPLDDAVIDDVATD